MEGKTGIHFKTRWGDPSERKCFQVWTKGNRSFVYDRSALLSHASLAGRRGGAC